MINFKTKDNKKLTFRQALPKILSRVNNYFLDLLLFFLAIVGYIPFHSLRLFFYRLSGMKIGKGSTIHMWARFYDPRNIVIGEDTIIGDHCFLDGRDKLTIGNHTAIASQVLIYNSEHNINDEKFTAICQQIEIGDYCFIGPRAVILPGVKINKGAVVGACAVVTKEVAEKSIVGGVPAKVIGLRQIKNLNYKLGRARLFQ